MSELADEADSKSVGGNIVWVQVPLPAVKKVSEAFVCEGFRQFQFSYSNYFYKFLRVRFPFKVSIVL